MIAHCGQFTLKSLRPLRARHLQITLALPVLFLLTGSMPATAFAQLKQYSTEEFNQAIEKGSIPVGARIQVTGRKAFVLDRVINLQRCPTKFRAASSISELPVQGGNWLLSGTVSALRRGKTPAEVTVDQVEPIPSDTEEYRRRKSRIDDDDPEQWKALGRWVRQRGEFYRDQELVDLSEICFTKSIDLRRKAVREKDPRQLDLLADEAESLGLNPRLMHSLRHESWYRQWKVAREGTADQALQLAAAMRTKLDGCERPPAEPQTALLAQYQQRPFEVYDGAILVQRRAMHRYLYAELLLHAWLKQIESQQANGFEIADRIDKELPEYAVQADKLREQQLAAKAGEVNKLTRKEVMTLAEQYRHRQQPLVGEQVIDSWMALRRQRLTLEDTEGWLELASDYRTLLGRKETADRLLMEIWSKTQNNDIAEALEKAGYHLKDRTWLTEAEFRRRPEGRLEQALREGRIEPGMSAEQVQQSLGKPDNLARAYSAGQVTEIWSYGSSPADRLIIQLSRRKHQKQLLVTQIQQSH